MIDLFAGCGGMTTGFVSEGFSAVLAVEWELSAAATYAANFGESHTIWGDNKNVGNERIPDADVIIGGAPMPGLLQPRRQGRQRP